MTLHQESRLVWVLRLHVGDLMFAGGEADQLYLTVLWNRQEVCTIVSAGRQRQSKCVSAMFNKNETDASRSIRLNTLFPFKAFAPHRPRHQYEVLSRHEHHQVIANRNELGWLARQTTIALMAFDFHWSMQVNKQRAKRTEFVGATC